MLQGKQVKIEIEVISISYQNFFIPYAKKQGSVKRKAIVRWAKNDQFGIQFI